MGEILVPWGITALLAAIIVVVVMQGRRRREQTAEATVAATEEHHQEMLRLDAEHRQRIEASVAERVAATARAESFRMFAAKNIEWELASRETITSVCEELGLDGVLSTNITFVPDDAKPASPFIAQVDHVLLTERGALVIENKNWRGVVFDDRLPSSVHPAFGAIVPDDTLVPPFAVGLSPKGPETIKVLSLTGWESPRSQVRRQAQRLSRLIEVSLGQRVWFNTSIFYSHRDVELYAATSMTRNAETDVVAGRSGLRSAVQRFQQSTSRSATIPAHEIADLFSSLGADVRGFGSQAARWPSVFDAVDVPRIARESSAERT